MRTLEFLRGITAEDCRRLRARGIRHTNQLLHACTLDVDRRKLSDRTGISPDRLLEFAHQSALLEISGLDRYMQVVRRLGIVDLKKLRHAEATNLQSRIVDALGLAGSPSLSTVQYWVSQARSIDMIEEAGQESALDVSPSIHGSRPTSPA